MRGFRVEKAETRVVACEQPLLYYVRETEVKTQPLERVPR